jgi:hypothetical protein
VTRVTRQLPPAYGQSRASLHRLAEHVLAPARHQATGRIGLRQTPGGFGTPPFGSTDRVIAVDGREIVVTDRSGQTPASRRAAITTVRDAADFVGVEPGAPASVYRPNTPLEPDAPLLIDDEAVDVIAMWYELTAKALSVFATSIADDEPSEAQLWPEHFDLALTADRINYGGSPGDEYIEVPYLYVGPFEGRPDEAEPFWNQPFGAALAFDEVAAIDDALSFFRRGRELTRRARGADR